MKRIALCCLMALFVFNVYGQKKPCNIILSGSISLKDTTKIVANLISVNLPESQQGAYTDSTGAYSITSICPGNHKVRVSCLGYKTIDTLINFSRNLTLHFQLEREFNLLNTVTIMSQKVGKDDITTASKSELTGIALEQVRGLSLGEELKTISGLNSFQTGPNISKPVIDGLYGNRILIMNNDVRQEGQNWGNDHAPEIDPFIGDQVTVIKGAASIRYGSDALGGVILVQPKELRTLPGIDGAAYFVGMSNGRMGGTSGMLEGALSRKLKGLSWRVQGTLKKAGNAHAGNYYLENTGYYEEDYSLTLKYTHANYGIEAYYSEYYNRTGIAWASSIGSLSDLYLAFKSARPNTADTFSYNIARGYALAHHRLLKVNGFLDLKKWGRLEGIYAIQRDIREEFDYDEPNNPALANDPDLFFQLITVSADGVWLHPNLFKKITGSIGFNFLTHRNIQQSTGYSELIPNFIDYGGGIFIIEKWVLEKLTLEAGGRYDYRWLQVYLRNPTTIVPYVNTYNWQSATFTAGGLYNLNRHLSTNINAGSAWRPPQVIELFANGIHQSAASYEHGDSLLNLEKAYDSNISIKYSDKKLFASVTVYANYFHNYIYLKPDAVPQTTIDGVFPSFTYTQVNAIFKGMDITVGYDFLKYFSITGKASIVRAKDADNGQWLVNIPADRFDNTLKFQFPEIGKLKAVYISANNLIVPEQVRVEPNSDYVSPPPGYMLWGASVGCSVPFYKQLINISLSCTNLTNIAYRDYMDRFRYFMDDPGRNIILRVKIPFEISGTK